jgi:SAM-dependent methyltransferase
VFRVWLLQTLLGDGAPVYEFGCGSGYNLPVLARRDSDRAVVGLDWSSASVEIARQLARTYPNISGRLFDMYEPSRHGSDFVVPGGSIALTVGAMEQLGDRFVPFIAYLQSRFVTCVHVEPIVEWYQVEELPDYLAHSFHVRRGYLSGLPAHLESLRARGEIEIVKSHRVEFGSLFHDGWSMIVWRTI